MTEGHIERLSGSASLLLSLATSLYRTAMTGLVNAAKEVAESGTFGYLDATLTTSTMNGFMRG
jgi:hypothetical protein